MARTFLLALGLGTLLIVGSTAHAAGSPDLKCKEAKMKEAGKKAASLLKAFGKNISKNPDTKLGANISKAESKFSKGFSKAEAKGGCVTTGDATAIEEKVDGFVLDCIRAISPSPSGAFLDRTLSALD